MAVPMKPSADSYSPYIHFQHWYPHYRSILETILHQNCSVQFKHYLNGTCQPSEASIPDCNATPVVRCLLANLDEVVKADFAAAALVLALMPTILALAGSTTAEPTTNPMRTFEYRSPVKIVRPHPDGIVLPKLSSYTCKILSLLEYALASATIINLAFVTYDLTLRTVTSIATLNIWYMTIWVTTAMAVHLLGSLSVCLRVRIQTTEQSRKTRVPGLAYLVDEFSLTSRQRNAQLWFRRESHLFVGFSWFTSIVNIVHIVYGTLAFSTLLFVDTTMAVIIFARIFANTIFCRALLMFELSGMRQRVVVCDRPEDEEGSKMQ